MAMTEAREGESYDAWRSRLAVCTTTALEMRCATC